MSQFKGWIWKCTETGTVWADEALNDNIRGLGEKFWYSSSSFWMITDNRNERAVHLNSYTSAACSLSADNGPKSEAGTEATNKRMNGIASSVSKGHQKGRLNLRRQRSVIWPAVPLDSNPSVSHDDVDDDRCAWGARGGGVGGLCLLNTWWM